MRNFGRCRARYSYDSASQPASIAYQNGATLLGNLTYIYDNAGRRVQMGGSFARTGLPQPVTTTSYNAANRLTQWGTATLTYDLNGNMMSDGVNSFVWNARNQLASMNLGSRSFQYDAYGRRTSKTISGITTNYLYDRANIVQELSGTTPTANLLSGGIDEVFSRTDGTGSSTFVADALGSTLALADPTGILQAQYTYEPFGNTTIAGTSTNPFQYLGREDNGAGVYYYRARYYAPALQRFISEDPVDFAGGMNLYAYTSNSPTNLRDPSGKNPLAVGVAVCAAGAVVGAGYYAYYSNTAGRKTTFNGYAWSAAGGCAAGLALAFGGGLLPLPFAAGGGLAAAGGAGAGTYVFYSGGQPALQAAQEWSAANNGIMIGATEFGQAIQNGTMTVEEASEAFANSASGAVQVFSNAPLTNFGDIWFNYELPALASNPNVTNIVFNPIPGKP
jgi:RHS repeat-associated protein